MNEQRAASAWRRSSFCDANNCVEVARHSETVMVRDNARPEPHLSFDSDSWQGLLHDIRSGRLDR